MGVVKVGYQPSDGPDLLLLTTAKKKPRATAGLELIGVEQTKGTDWLKARRAAA